MKPSPRFDHHWDLSPREAVALQRELATRVRCEPLSGRVRTIAGIDVSVRGKRARAAVVVVRLPTSPDGVFGCIDTATHEADVRFPYVPGLLSFREIPALLPALAQLRKPPDVLMCDGQGYAHPRRCGLACHLGVLLGWPALGVAKSRLVGEHDEPGPERGDRVPLRHRGETLGAVLRTRTRVKPVFVSVGHRITLDEAVALTLACAPRYRLPEPARLAHRLSRGEALN